MLISIVIATYNAEKTLQRCIDSIIPQLTDHVELIIIDGGSIDNTCEIIKSNSKYITYSLSEKDNGVYDAWNKGILKANGDWILFIGSDDILKEDAIDQYLSYVKDNPNYDFVSAKVNYLNDKMQTIAITGKQWDYNRCRINMDVTHVASITNRNYFKRVGLFNTKYKIVGDYELLMRGGSEIKAGFLNHIVANMAIGGISFSVKGLKEQMRVKREIAKMPTFICILIFLYQLVAFYTYKLRHRA